MIFAYIDPGSGSMLIQVAIAGLLAVPFFLRSTIARGIDRLRGRRPDPQPSQASAPDPDESA